MGSQDDGIVVLKGVDGFSHQEDNGLAGEVDNRRKSCGKIQTHNGSLGLGRPSLHFLHDFDDVVEGDDIPQFLREHKATLRFPATLLYLLVQAEREALKTGRTTTKSCIGWTADGRAFIIRNKEELTNKLLPLAFSTKAKFSSFTRKLYRWGFRQVKDDRYSSICKAGELVFWHPHFQRDNRSLILNMKSITAEGTRRALAHQSVAAQSGQSTSLNDIVRTGQGTPSIAGRVLPQPHQLSEVLAMPDVLSPSLELPAATISSPPSGVIERNQELMLLSLAATWPSTIPSLCSNPLTSDLLRRFHHATQRQVLAPPPESAVSRLMMLRPLVQPRTLTVAGNDPLGQLIVDARRREATVQSILQSLEFCLPESVILPTCEQVNMYRPSFRSW